MFRWLILFHFLIFLNKVNSFKTSVFVVVYLSRWSKLNEFPFLVRHLRRWHIHGTWKYEILLRLQETMLIELLENGMRNERMICKIISELRCQPAVLLRNLIKIAHKLTRQMLRSVFGRKCNVNSYFLFQCDDNFIFYDYLIVCTRMHAPRDIPFLA